MNTKYKKYKKILKYFQLSSYYLGMGRYTYLPIRYYHDTRVPIRYVLRFFFKNFDSTNIAIRYCFVLRFLFLTLDHEKKLNDRLNIQTVTIYIYKKKKHLSSHYCDSILQFTVIFVCLLKQLLENC